MSRQFPIPALLLAIAVAFAMTACVDESGSQVLPEEIEDWADGELLDEFASMGLTIHGGTSAPEVAGVYSVKDARIEAHGDPDMVGRRVEPADWAFFEQEGHQIAVSALEYEDEGVLNLNGLPAFISGEDDCFSIFAYDDRRAPGASASDDEEGDDDEGNGEEEDDENGEDDEVVEDGPCPHTQGFIISGCLDSEEAGIVDFQVGDRTWRFATEDGRCEASTSELRVVGQEFVERIGEIEEENGDDDE